MRALESYGELYTNVVLEPTRGALRQLPGAEALDPGSSMLEGGVARARERRNARVR